jgi:hypothetical protein
MLEPTSANRCEPGVGDETYQYTWVQMMPCNKGLSQLHPHSAELVLRSTSSLVGQ